MDTSFEYAASTWCCLRLDPDFPRRLGSRPAGLEQAEAVEHRRS